MGNVILIENRENHFFANFISPSSSRSFGVSEKSEKVIISSSASPLQPLLVQSVVDNRVYKVDVALHCMRSSSVNL